MLSFNYNVIISIINKLIVKLNKLIYVIVHNDECEDI